MKIHAPNVPIIAEELLRDPARLLAENPMVSAFSAYRDESWNLDVVATGQIGALTGHRTIHWRLFNRPAFPGSGPVVRALIDTCKHAVVLLRHGPARQDPATLAQHARQWLMLIEFMTGLPMPVCRFRDLDATQLGEFFEAVKARPGIKGQTLTWGSVKVYYNNLVKLHILRDQVEDGLWADPAFLFPRLPGRSTTNGKLATEPIPDEDWRRIILFAERYVREHTAPILERLRQWWSRPGGGCRDEYWDERQEHYDVLATLRSACFVLIAASTGMRVGEILALRRGCLSEDRDPETGQVFRRLRSLQWKLQERELGRKARWLCGPLAPLAVSCLESMGKVMLREISTEDHPLFMPFDRVKLWINRPDALCPYWARQSLKDLYICCGTATYTPHQYRRTFARHVVRWGNVPILALQEHFKHVWTDMTWAYAHDEELIGWLLEEVSARKASESAGSAGEPTYSINTGRHYKRRDMDLLRSAEVPMLPCDTATGGFTFCGSVGGAHRPMVAGTGRRTALSLPADPDAFHRLLLKRAEAGYSGLGEGTRSGPEGQIYREHIRSLRAALGMLDLL